VRNSRLVFEDFKLARHLKLISSTPLDVNHGQADSDGLPAARCAWRKSTKSTSLTRIDLWGAGAPPISYRPSSIGGRDPSVSKIAAQFKRWGLRGAVLAVAVAAGWLLAIHSTSPTRSPSTTSPTVNVTIPDKPDQFGHTVTVAIPDLLFDKLAKIAHPGALETVWPAISALLGALVGGGVTLLANKEQSSAEKAAALSSRKAQIRDRGLAACVDVLKTAQLYYNEVNSLWWDLQNAEPKDVIEGHSASFDEALRNHYAANAVARLAIPPTLKNSFKDYIKAVRDIADVVSEWEADYVPGSPSFDPGTYSTPQDRYTDLTNDMVTKREIFEEAARTVFAEDAYS
jgi:hypothetical protein